MVEIWKNYFIHTGMLFLVILSSILICGCSSEDMCNVIPCDTMKPLFDAYMYKIYLLNPGIYPDSRDSGGVYGEYLRNYWSVPG